MTVTLLFGLKQYFFFLDCRSLLSKQIREEYNRTTYLNFVLLSLNYFVLMYFPLHEFLFFFLPSVLSNQSMDSNNSV
jgi:hypothetical protein